MDFVNLISATLVLTLFVNLTAGHTNQGSGAFEIVPKNNKFERKRFLLPKQNAAWIPWSSWSICSHNCGGGFQTRDRMCNTGVNSDCEGHSYDVRDCNVVPCNATATSMKTPEPTEDGVWGEWVGWSSCSKSCRNATQSRSRLCRFESAVSQGKVCDGDAKESKFCNTGRCPITCSTCGDNPPDLCELLFEQNTVCPEPYCVNIVRNTEGGQRLVERKCGSLHECRVDWWQQTSQLDKCNLFNENFIYTQSFDCTYCCTTANCNTMLHPETTSLYKET